MKVTCVAFSCVVALLLTVLPSTESYLQVYDGAIRFKGEKIFLSGANIAWNCKTCDFGDGRYDTYGPKMEGWLRQIGNAGGNFVRVWVHFGGQYTPAFDSNGYVTGPDKSGTIINDMKRFLDVAAESNVLVMFVLWNGAVAPEPQGAGVVNDPAKLQSYIDNALVPMVKALNDHPALGAWEIINEPCGSWAVESNSNWCADSTLLSDTKVGWSGAWISPYNYLRFINWQVDAIHNASAWNAKVTVGAWDTYPLSDTIGKKNYFSDNCLVSIGGRSGGVLDFYTVHSYVDSSGYFPDVAPFNVNAADFGLDKPLAITEFASRCSRGRNINDMMDYSYYHGYQGAVIWQYNESDECSDAQSVENEGMQHVRYYTDTNNGGVVAIDV